MPHDGGEELRRQYQNDGNGGKVFIPAKPKACLNDPAQMFRVCAYCRVSTDHEEQLSSFALQQTHYRQMADEHPNWNLKRVYADGPVIIALNQQTLDTSGVALI